MGWWGLVIGIVAIALTIPLGIVANIITPVLISWLATWTDSSLRRRIARLEEGFARLEKECPLMTSTEEQFLLGILCVVQLLSFGLHMFGLAALIVATMVKSPAITSEARIFLCSIFGGCALLTWSWRKSVVNGLRKYRLDHSEKCRKAYRKSINNLKSIAAK
jgi:membrane protein implicated in regulation of membrane protease activity